MCYQSVNMLKTRFAHAALRVIAPLTMWVWVGCGTGSQGPAKDTYSSGSISIATDATLQPLIAQELAVFDSTYPDANITPIYTTEAEAFGLLMKDSVRMVVATRGLYPPEEDAFKQTQVTPRVQVLAYDALVLVINKSNPDSLMSLPELKGVLTGTYATWTKLHAAQLSPNQAPRPPSTKDSIRVVVDHAQGSTARYLIDSVLGKGTTPQQLFAVGSHDKVLDYVAQNPHAIGVVGLLYVADLRENLNDLELNPRVRLVRLARQPSENPKDYYLPYQVSIARDNYPMWRTIMAIRREAYNGLGTGFTSFLAGDIGQRIAARLDLLPYQKISRRVELRDKLPE